jgi:hypothetical protein
LTLTKPIFWKEQFLKEKTNFERTLIEKMTYPEPSLPIFTTQSISVARIEKQNIAQFSSKIAQNVANKSKNKFLP